MVDVGAKMVFSSREHFPTFMITSRGAFSGVRGLKCTHEMKIKFVLFERTLEMIKELHV